VCGYGEKSAPKRGFESMITHRSLGWLPRLQRKGLVDQDFHGALGSDVRFEVALEAASNAAASNHFVKFAPFFLDTVP